MKKNNTYEISIYAIQDIDTIGDYEEREALEEEINEEIESIQSSIEKWCKYNCSSFDTLEKHRCIVSTSKEYELIETLNKLEESLEEASISYDIIEE